MCKKQVSKTCVFSRFLLIFAHFSSKNAQKIAKIPLFPRFSTGIPPLYYSLSTPSPDQSKYKPHKVGHLINHLRKFFFYKPLQPFDDTYAHSICPPLKLYPNTITCHKPPCRPVLRYPYRHFPLKHFNKSKVENRKCFSCSNTSNIL